MTGGRRADGGAGDADYGVIGSGYARHRRPDPRIAARIRSALGDARTLVNVGAGPGSYEPTDLAVTAVEPSASMRAQRPPHLPRAVAAVAERLPFADGAFDAALASSTVHQWRDLAAGLSELRRVTRGPVVVMTSDPDRLQFWLEAYCPEVLEAEARRMPPIPAILEGLGGGEVQGVPIPLDCRDGFDEAYYGRPERLLDPQARLACSSWSFVTPDRVARFEAALRRDLASGAWDARWGHLRRQSEFDGSLRLVVSRPPRPR